MRSSTIEPRTLVAREQDLSQKGLHGGGQTCLSWNEKDKEDGEECETKTFSQREHVQSYTERGKGRIHF